MPLGAARAVLLAAGAGAAASQAEFAAGAVLRLEDGSDLRLADGESRLLLVPQEEPE